MGADDWTCRKGTGRTSIYREGLVDINSFKINAFAPIDVRARSFFDQIKDPYCFLYDSTPVRISFSEEGGTLQECLTRYFVSRKQGQGLSEPVC